LALCSGKMPYSVGVLTMIDTNAMVKRWMEGDERAAEALYQHHRDRVFGLAYGLLGDASEAEEAAQDALTYALLNIRRFDANRASFLTWLNIITVSRCRDRYRRRRFRIIALPDWMSRGKDIPDPGPGPESHLVETEERSQVWSAVRDLSPQLREAILLRYWAGHTYKEISEILGCPLRTAQSRVRLAFRELRKVLAPVQNNGFDEAVVR
jgi:RNA polymerase sigma factor (sigma-70 family)